MCYCNIVRLGLTITELLDKQLYELIVLRLKVSIYKHNITWLTRFSLGSIERDFFIIYNIGISTPPSQVKALLWRSLQTSHSVTRVSVGFQCQKSTLWCSSSISLIHKPSCRNKLLEKLKLSTFTMIGRQYWDSSKINIFFYR